jgi:hypothetical protein
LFYFNKINNLSLKNTGITSVLKQLKTGLLGGDGLLINLAEVKTAV